MSKSGLQRLLFCFTLKQQSNQSSQDESTEVDHVRPVTTSSQTASGTASLPTTRTANSATPSFRSRLYARYQVQSNSAESATTGRADHAAPSTGARVSAVKEENQDLDAITPAPHLPTSSSSVTDDMPTGQMYTNVKNAVEDRRRLLARLRNPDAASMEPVVGTARHDFQPSENKGTGERGSMLQVNGSQDAGEGREVVQSIEEEDGAKAEDVEEKCDGAKTEDVEDEHGRARTEDVEEKRNGAKTEDIEENEVVKEKCS